jgi:hypothetical protein
MKMERLKEYEKLVTELNRKKVPARVVLTSDGEIDVLCGFDYPERLANQIDGIAAKFKIENVEIMADQAGVTTIRSSIVGGGPKRYFAK